MKINNTKSPVLMGGKHKISKRVLQDHGWAYLMIGPTIIGLIILNIWPMIETVYMSFNNISGFGTSTWAGLANYHKLFSDPEVLSATVNTFGFTLVTVVVGVFLSIVAAVLLNCKIGGKSIYRTIYFLPIVSTPTAIAMVWRWLYNSDYGLINYSLSLIGIHGQNWLANSHFVLCSIIIVGIWSSIGYNMVILLAGLQGVPQTFYEAADIDGAGAFKKFINITIPLLSPTLFFVIVTSIIGSLQVFDFIFMMVDSTNPALGSAQSLVYLFYKYSFVMYNRGYGSAIITYLLVIILIITAIQMKIQKKWVYYQ